MAARRGPWGGGAKPGSDLGESWSARDAINHRLGHAGHASVGTQNLRSTTERPLPCVRKM